MPEALHAVGLKCWTPAHRLLEADFKLSILHHVDAVVQLSRAEDVLPFVQLDEDHVLAQLQEEGLLKMPKNPVQERGG